MINKALTSLRAAGIFFCFLPEGILCNTVDKALDGDLWLTGDPLLGVHWLSEMHRMNILLPYNGYTEAMILGLFAKKSADIVF